MSSFIKQKHFSARNFFLLLGSTLSVMAGAIVTPALPKLSAHFSDAQNIEFLTKLIISIPPLFIAIFSPIAGRLFELFGRKRVLILSSILYALSGASGFLSDNIFLILIGRAMLGVSIAGLMSGFIAVAGDLFSGSSLNKFIGIQGAIMSFGGVAYLLAGGLLADIAWNVPFLGYLTALLVAIGLWWFLPETFKPESKTKLPKLNLSKELMIIYLMAVYVMFLYLMIPTQLPFLMTKNYPDFNPSKIGLYLAIWIFFSSSASLLYSIIKKKMSFKSIYMLGFATWAIGTAMFYLSGSIFFLLLALIFSGLGNGLVVPNLKANLLSISSMEDRGRLSGLLSMSLYIGQFISPIVVQPLLNFISIEIIFVVFAIATFLMIIPNMKSNLVR